MSKMIVQVNNNGTVSLIIGHELLIKHDFPDWFRNCLKSHDGDKIKFLQFLEDHGTEITVDLKSDFYGTYDMLIMPKILYTQLILTYG